MNSILQLEKINIFINILKVCSVSIYAYYLSTKIINKLDYSKSKKILTYIIIFIIAIVCGVIRWAYSFNSSIIILILLLSIIFAINTKNDIGYSLCISSIALSLSYILYFIAICISFIPTVILNINNNYINFIIVMLLYIILIYFFSKIKRFKQGFSFLQKNSKNNYFDIIILNISVIILFFIIVLSNYKTEITGNIGVAVIFFSIIMFITIQKSLQLYYKQKLLIQELNETKKELDKKKQEIEQLERENLNFSKTSHSIAHRQKALEYKLNQLMLKTEIASEIDIKDKINEIAKELQTPTEVELSKTNISEIDNMLKYMQSECVKNKIDFQLQLSGNIHHMINKYVSKENLEILIADHIKNSIIAINHSDNINKSILIRLGIIDGIYSLYIYDSGVEFEIDTLLKLGKIPSTTHSDDGGTGMGFMNTFNTLKKYKASIVIKEYGKPCKDNYTKLIIIKFDDKNEYKICSYRQKEIKNKDNNNNLIVEELSL